MIMRWMTMRASMVRVRDEKELNSKGLRSTTDIVGASIKLLSTKTGTKNLSFPTSNAEVNNEKRLEVDGYSRDN